MADTLLDRFHFELDRLYFEPNPIDENDIRVGNIITFAKVINIVGEGDMLYTGKVLEIHHNTEGDKFFIVRADDIADRTIDVLPNSIRNVGLSLEQEMEIRKMREL